MPNWINLREVLQHPEVYGDIACRNVAYTPQKQVIMHLSRETGYSRDQKFSTELKHTYYPVLYENRVYLVAGETNKMTLNFRGIIGYNNAVEVIKQNAKLYSNSELGAIGLAWTEDTVKILRVMPKALAFIEADYLMASTFRYSNWPNNYFLCIKVQYKNHVERFPLYSSEPLDYVHPYAKERLNESHLYCGNIRPLVLLSTDTMVDMDAENNKPLKLKLPDN